MAVEYLALWGVAQIAGFVFKPILEDLATKAASKFAEDYLKGCLKNVLTPEEKEGLTKVVGVSLKDFLQIVQDELEGCGLEESEITPLVKPLQELLTHRVALDTLRAPLLAIDTPTSGELLADSWNELHLPDLPREFSWSRIANRFGKKANQLRRESPELRSVLDSQMVESIATSLKATAPISPDDDLRRLQKAISKAYGYLKLEAMDATTYDLNRIRLDRLFIAQHVREFTEFVQQVFEVPKEYQQRVKLLGQLQEQVAEQRELSRFRKAYLKQSPRSVLQLVQNRDNRLLVVLGDPGSGKSSLLQVTALQWAEYSGHDMGTLEVPFLIELREYARNRQDGVAKDFLEYLHKGAGVVCRFDQHAIAARLREGKALLLFDGLDEVFDPDQRKEICADIARFANDFNTARIIVTSRVIGYKAQTLRDAGFRHFMLQDLDNRQIDEFLSRWHGLAYPNRQEGDDKRRLLTRAVADSKAIRELAGNPLLLTMMAILNRTQDLPRDRAELYTQCSRLLLYQWKADEALRADGRFNGITIDLKDKQAMLRRVAREMQGSEQGLAGNLIPHARLELILEDVLGGLGLLQAKLLARAVIDHLRTRNFVLCYVGGDHYAFVHRTFLEYFCATDFLWQFKEEQTIDLNHLKSAVFRAHFEDETWEETLCLICGMLVPKLAAEIVEYLLSISAEDGRFINVLLAARCFSEVRNKSEVQPTAGKLRAALRALVSMPIPQKPPKVQDAGHLVQPNREGEIEKYLQEAKARSDLANKIRLARPRALVALTSIWRDGDTLKWLQDTIASLSTHASIREAALRRIIDGWGEQEFLLRWLLHLAVARQEPVTKPGHPKSLLRLAVLSHLVRTWPDHPDVASLIEELAANAYDYIVQEWAVQQVGQKLTNDPTRLEVIHKALSTNPTPPVRRECFRALAKLGSPDSRSLELAKVEALSGSGAKTKRAVVRILAKGPVEDIEIPKLLQAVATTSLSRKMNIQARSVLKQTWNHLPEVQSFLQSQETNAATPTSPPSPS